MNLAGLSFNALPPISIPFRYFATAPLFIIAIAFFMLFNGEQIWSSRWHPSTILVTHGFTLGFFTMVMMGAIIQILPVVGGVGIPQVKLIGKLCHSLHTIGTTLLLIHFAWPHPYITIMAICMLALSFTLYISAVASVLIKKLSQGETIVGIRLAISTLALTILLGLLLLAQYLGIDILPQDKVFTNLHLMLGFGWVSLLIISVSFQVVPMFHVAPSFPTWLMKLLPLSIFLLLIAALIIPNTWLPLPVIVSALLLIHCLFAITLLRVIKQRKRQIADTTISFWQLAAISLFAITILMIIPAHWWPQIIQANFPLLIGALFIYFFASSVLLGMLLKILPFLSYTHLQQRCLTQFSAMAHLPNMHAFISKRQGLWLFILHLASGCSLIATILMPMLNPVFSLLLLSQFAWLGLLITNVCLRYHHTSKLIDSLES
ncbi:hypothetical protein [Thalassotalea sp. G2M2-11]|uniref:hypothetical protein n=1 Tax=Thalassotalea sp. G2M2-11 TaxID=2787627 RepID=UPI0019D2B2D4|nr:hypothetical protein [Thalassotalea sp. G2M2-11]